MNRRRFLKATAATGSIGLFAGCLNSDAAEGDPTDTEGDPTADHSPTEDPATTSPESSDEPTTDDPTPTTDEPTHTETPDSEQIGDETTTDGGSSGGQAWASGGVMDGVSFEFTSRAPECGQGTDDTDVEFDTDAGEIVVEGVISGSDLCKRARLADLTHDTEDDHLTVAIESVDREDCDVGGQCLVDIPYEAVFSFDGDIPTNVSVSHDGNGIASAAFSSNRVTPPAETTTE